jgi:cytochrome c551/c552
MFVVGASRNAKFLSGLMLAIGSMSAQTPDAAEARGNFVRQYCVGCHSEGLKTGGLVLENVDAARVSSDAGIWERVLRQVNIGQMPPAGMPHPDDSARSAFTENLETALDLAASANPNPGLTMPAAASTIRLICWRCRLRLSSGISRWRVLSAWPQSAISRLSRLTSNTLDSTPPLTGPIVAIRVRF